MVQTYSLILWKEATEMSDSATADLAFEMLRLLKNYGDELNPKYQTVKRKNDATPFLLTRENLGVIIENSLRRGRKHFPDLGGTFSFFSSLDEKRSSGIMCALGSRNPQFHNTIVISLPYSDFSGFSDRNGDFRLLFKSLISVFSPYFALIYNNQNKQISDELWSDKPTYVHWMNYYSNDTIKRIGERRVKSLEGIELNKEGAFLQLFDEPFDINNQKHLDKQREVSEQLGLL